MKFFKYVVLPFFAAAVAVALAAAAVPGGSNLADIPGDTKMYTASDVAALFSALDPESAEDALSRIIAENEVLAGALRTNIVAIHEADVARDTNFASRPVVLSPAASDATISYGDLPSVYVGSATLPDARVVVVGDLESAANGDWENALGAAGDFARAIEYDGDFYDPFGCSFEEVRTYFSFLYDLLWGGSGVQPWDTASALRDFVEYAHANPSGGGGNFNVSNLVDRIDSLENTVSGLSPCSCEESQGCSCGDSIASAAAALASAVSAFESAVDDLEARLSAVEEALDGLTPATVTIRGDPPPGKTREEAVADAIQDAQENADQARNDDMPALQDALADVIEAAEELGDEIEGVVIDLGDV